jgi:hypothetical protein
MGAMNEALVTGPVGALVALEILDGALVLLGGVPRRECAKISALPRLGILLPGIQPISARL